jgi:hypothetical protein
MPILAEGRMSPKGTLVSRKMSLKWKDGMQGIDQHAARRAARRQSQRQL